MGKRGFCEKGSFFLPLLFVLVMLRALPAEGATIYRYVNANAAPGGNGQSWATACKELRTALAAASGGTEIWVAKGTYTPHEDDRTVSFALKDDVALYGGFAGTETLREQRDIAANPTILSGNIGDLEIVTDNICHVVTADGVGDTAVLDGFTITGGYGFYIDGHRNGGGMRNINNSSPTVSNCTFSENAAVSGGAMYNDSSSPTVTNCTFSENFATDFGGAMNNHSSSPTVTNCTFMKNTSSFFPIIVESICNYFSSRR